MSFEISDFNLYENNTFYLCFFWKEKNIYVKLSYKIIYEIYLKSLEEESKNIIYILKNKKGMIVRIYFKDIDEFYFFVYFKEIPDNIKIYKKLRIINIKNNNNEIKTFRVFNMEQIIFLMGKENLNFMNSRLLNEQGNETQYLDETNKIEFNSDKNEKNIFQIFSSLSPEDPRVLTLNFEKYFKVSNFKYTTNKNREKFYSYLNVFIGKSNINGNMLLLSGLSGIGKTISLLYFLSKAKIGHCYFDIKRIFEKYDNKLLFNESFKLFGKIDFDKYSKYFDEVFKIDNNWIKIQNILSKSYDFNTKIIVIDNYKTCYDKGFKNIYNLSKLFPYYKFIICYSLSDISFWKITLNYYLKEKNKSIFSDIYIIEDELYTIKNIVNKDESLCQLFSLFNYNAKCYNIYLENNFQQESDDRNEKFLSFMLEKYSRKLSKFLGDKFLCEKYKEIHFYIINKEKINKRQIDSFIKYIPLKFITIKIQDDNNFIIQYSLPFVFHLMKKYYFNELLLLNKIKIINNMNKRCEIGNIFDDIVNIKFNLNNEALGLKIKTKIILNSILDLNKVFMIITEKNKEIEINYELYTYNKNSSKEISLNKIFDDSKVIFLLQHNQGRNYDGAILIPIKNNPGSYYIFLYQTTIKKNIKFYINLLLEDFDTIKKKLYEFFGIEIVDGFFAYILYYEEKDFETVNHCKINNIGYFFYSFNLDKFVDETGKEIETILNYNYYINKKEKIDEFYKLKKNILILENYLKPKKNKNKINLNDVLGSGGELEKLYLGKKIFFASFNNEKENKIIKNKNLTDLNKCFKEKYEILSKNKKIKKQFSFRGVKSKSIDILNQNLEKENLIFSEKINKIKGIANINTKINKANQNSELNEKKSVKELPKKIKEIFPKFNAYREHGHFLINEMEYPELPSILVYQYENKYQFIQYKKDKIIITLNLGKKKEFTNDDKIKYFNYISTGKIKILLWELISGDE